VSRVNFIFAAISAIVLFLYGLQAFTREIQAVGGDKLRNWLGRLTRTPLRGVLLGALATAIVQSSSAVVALAISLVDSGILTFLSSLGVVLGANIGTTSTAWLVSMRLTDIGPFFIVLGTIIAALPWRFRILGKAAFYFGFIFFGLDLVGSTLKPLAQTPMFEDLVRRASVPIMGVAVGVALTALVQSSTIVTGLCIVMVQQGVLTAQAAIPIVIGTNIGTTLKGLLITIGMKGTARRVAIANIAFNTIGVLLILPFLRPFAASTAAVSSDPGIGVAWAQFLFNLGMTIVGLVLIRIFRKRLLAADSGTAAGIDPALTDSARPREELDISGLDRPYPSKP
jgi:phosphate:Na+ symporter